MARTPSNTALPLGSACPAFELIDVLSGGAVGRDDLFAGPDERTADGDRRSGLLVVFLSPHCPFVQHMEAALTAVMRDYADRIAFAPVCSNSLTQPEDSADGMRAQAARLGWDALGLAYLDDPAQETARAFHAACTPDLYLFDAEYTLVYHGAFDPTRPYRASDERNGVAQDPAIHKDADGSSLRAALDNLLAGNPPLANQPLSLGCNIKWRDDGTAPGHM